MQSDSCRLVTFPYFSPLHSQHQQFGIKHQQNPALVREVANRMARIHHISVPLRKSAENWALKQIRQFLESAFENCNVAQLIEELNLTTLKEKDIWKEFAKLEKLIDTANSAQVSF